jgi:hypothetical protein
MFMPSCSGPCEAGSREELEDSEPGESGGEADKYCVSACVRKDDSGLEDELEYFWDAPIPSDPDKCEEDRWWSPGPGGPSSEEEDEEEVRYLVSLLGGEHKGSGNEEKAAPPRVGAEAGPSGEGCQVSVKEPVEEGKRFSGPPRNGESPTMKGLKRRKLRKKGTASGIEEWEAARHDAWLRELLTDSSEGESVDEYSRFAESGRWIAEMTDGRDRELRKQGKDKEMKM